MILRNKANAFHMPWFNFERFFIVPPVTTGKNMEQYRSFYNRKGALSQKHLLVVALKTFLMSRN